jgi:predicted phage tail protein
MANQAVYGIMGDRTNAEKAIQALIDAGANPQDISILSSQSEEFHEFESEWAQTELGRNWRTEERVTDSSGKLSGEHLTTPSKGGMGTERHTKAPEGATAGGLTGGIIGGVLGLLAGIGALAIPGMGAFIAAGPLMATLSGIGAGGTVGGIIGALAGAGIPEYEAKRYENRLKEGGVLLSIRANNDDLAKRWKEILKKQGAEDVTLSTEASTASKNYHKK